jgi:Zn-dependent protease
VDLSPEALVLDAVMIAIFLGIAFPVHECAHALVAYMRGDATAKLYGRISLNPVVHFDPVGGLMTVISILLGGFLIGWAKPTPVNPNNLRDRRNDEVLVALAGPVSNLLMAVIGALVVRLVVAADANVPQLVALALVNFVVFNVMLAIFNLIPIPPLDGSNLLFRFLPLHLAWQIRPFLAQYGIFILLGFVLLASRLLSGLIYGVAFALMGLG